MGVGVLYPISLTAESTLSPSPKSAKSGISVFKISMLAGSGGALSGLSAFFARTSVSERTLFFARRPRGAEFAEEPFEAAADLFSDREPFLEDFARRLFEESASLRAEEVFDARLERFLEAMRLSPMFKSFLKKFMNNRKIKNCFKLLRSDFGATKK